MRIGIVGYQGSGKSTLLRWLTGTAADPALAHTTQSALAVVPDQRIGALCDIYRPKKVTQASLELLDTPGLSRTHEGSATRLAMIREVGCLVVVVAAYGGADPLADLRNFDDDLLIADHQIVSGRAERLRESIKKPRPDREQQQAELTLLEPLVEALESGRALRDLDLTPQQRQAIRSFQLFSEKPRLVIFNVADDDEQPERWLKPLPDQLSAIAVSLVLQWELSQMDPEERDAFCQEMGVKAEDAGDLLRTIMALSGQLLFFTVGEKEVRSWMIPRGATAVEAADSIHTDLARGFVRAETMKCDDLIRLGSEREVKAANLMRHEPKGYVVQEGEILHILSSV